MDDPGMGPQTVGRRRRTTNGAPPIWFGIPFTVLGVLAIVFGFGALRDELRFGDDGATVEGVVIGRSYDPGDQDDAASYTIRYEFRDPATGASYSGSSGVSASVYSTVRDGDPVLVTYMPAEPTKHRLGTPEPQLLGPIAAMGVGLLFTIVGPILLLTTLGARRRAKADQIPAGATAEPLDPDRTDVFTRSPMQVFANLVIAPIGGVGFLAVAAFGLTQLTAQPFYLIASPLAAFFGVLLLAAGVASRRRGIRRKVLEVGPDGIWTPELGRLAWADVGEVRLEAARTLGPTRRRMTSTATYQRLGITPGDPTIAAHAPGGFVRALTSGFTRLTNFLRPSARLSLPERLSPFGINSYDLEQPIEAVLASVRRYVPVPVVDQSAAASMPAPMTPFGTMAGSADRDAVLSAAPPEPHHPLSDADIRAIDAQLGKPAAATVASVTGLAALATAPNPAVVAAPLVAGSPPPGVSPHRTELFRRRGFSVGDALSIILPGGSMAMPPAVGVVVMAIVGGLFIVLGPLFAIGVVTTSARSGLAEMLIPAGMAAVFVLIGLFMLRGLPARWRLATGDADLLGVGPEGLSLRGATALAWTSISSVETNGETLEIRLAGADATDAPTRFDFDLFEADADEIIDAIARYRVVDEV